MALKDLIPWRKHRRNVEVQSGDEYSHKEDNSRREEGNSVPSLKQEMNSLFEDAFRGFGLMPFGSGRLFDRPMGWPNIEVTETDQEVKVTAEVPGLEEKDLQVAFANGILAIAGEKKSEAQDESKRVSERSYSSFERQIPIDNVDENNVAATFKDGVLTVTLRKTAPTHNDARLI